MHEDFYKDLAAGVHEIKEKLPGKCDVTKESATFQHIVTVRPNDAMTLEFIYNDWYPSRVPKIRVKFNKKAQYKKSEKELESDLLVKAKSHEYLNTPMIPMLVDYADVAANQASSAVVAAVLEQRKNISSEIWVGDDGDGDKITRWAQPDMTLSYKENTAPVQSGASNAWRTGDTTASVDDWNTYEIPAQEYPTVDPSTENQWVGAVVSSSLWADGEDQTQWPELCDNPPPSDDWTEIPYRKKKTIPEEKQFDRKVTSALDSKVNSKTRGKGKGGKKTGSSARPNYFIAVRCTNPDIGDALEKVTSDIVSQNSVYDDICYNRNEIHVTICTLALGSERQIKRAVKVLQDMRAELISHAPKELLKIAGISEFNGGKVIYGQVDCPQEFLKFRALLRRWLQGQGVTPTDDDDDYTAHMTIGKITQTFLRRVPDVTNFPEHLYKKFINMTFGLQKVEGIHLCKMGFERREDGFYTCPVEIIF
ncbi:uncharacterized protein LOC121369482 [Gigantopelta aegis]|uniref:uncharacterized protein LOC121369482 n=1 Tax=Gigantopelta aegis TaxID=1735272 RepID=UPI001B88BA93|nr:uncharacterized protein LOC121369482 [Gigantopelta aegis]